MNKLNEAGDKVRKRIWELSDSDGRLNYAGLDMIEETVREVCVEYGRHQKENLLAHLSLAIISDPQTKATIASMLKHARKYYLD